MKKVVINLFFIISAIILLVTKISFGSEIAFILIGIVITEIYNFFVEFAGNLKMLIKIIINWNKKVRISFAYLFRIKIKNKYLLIMGNRIKKYQPVGGVYKFYDLNNLQRMGFNEMDEMKADGKNDKDLRGRIPANKLPKLIKWFNSQECREYDANREFNEELIYSGILDSEIFRNIEYKKVKTINSGIIKTPNYGLEYKIFDIIELIPSETQKEYLEDLVTNNTNDEITFVSEEEIIRHKRNVNTENFTNDITDHSESIL